MKFPSKTCLPKILSVLFIIFLASFALDESLNPPGFLVHLIPAILLLATVVLSFKFPKISGAIFIILGIAFTFFFHTYRDLTAFLILTIPPILIGILFILLPCPKKKKKSKH